MSNFAEFDVPEPQGSQPEENTPQETAKDNKPVVKTSKPKNKTSRKNNLNLSFILSIIGLIALFPVSFRTINLWFNTPAILPFQKELAPYTIILIIVSFVFLKLSSRNPLSKLGLLIFYITLAGFIGYKIYDFITTGAISWA